MKKRGFTLIELLAVIVILAVIALIATPLIMNVINDAKKNSFKDSAYGIVKAVQIRVAQAQIDNINGENVTYKINVGKENPGISYSGELPDEGWAYIDADGKVEMYVETGDYKAYYDENTSNQVQMVDSSNTTAYNTIKAKFDTTSGAYKDVAVLDATDTPITPPTPSAPTLTPGNYAMDFDHGIYLGQELPSELEKYDTAEEAIAAWPEYDYLDLEPWYEKYVIENGVVSKIFLEFQVTAAMVAKNSDLTAGTYELRGGVDETALPANQQQVYLKNKEVMNYVFGEDYCYEDDYDPSNLRYNCSMNEVRTELSAAADGSLMVGMSGDWPKCYVGEAYDETPAYAQCYP